MQPMLPIALAIVVVLFTLDILDLANHRREHRPRLRL
jgi:sterol desaturase/sphingolipid hydroxylase (fatty acid hydroxylase superfamily)